MIRFLLCPGNIPSKNDKQWHYVSAQRLAALYGVPMSECRVRPELEHRHGWDGSPGLIVLEPRYHGDYEVNRCSVSTGLT